MCPFGKQSTRAFLHLLEYLKQKWLLNPLISSKTVKQGKGGGAGGKETKINLHVKKSSYISRQCRWHCGDAGCRLVAGDCISTAGNWLWTCCRTLRNISLLPQWGISLLKQCECWQGLKYTHVQRGALSLYTHTYILCHHTTYPRLIKQFKRHGQAPPYLPAELVATVDNSCQPRHSYFMHITTMGSFSYIHTDSRRLNFCPLPHASISQFRLCEMQTLITARDFLTAKVGKGH